MKITGRMDYRVNLESIAMTDIILNMFIFFFISFSLLYTFNPYRIQKLEVKLPKATSTTPIKDKSQANITITDEGLIYLDKELVTRKELKMKIRIMLRNNPTLSVILRSDRLVRFKDVVNILDILSDLGITNLNIAATTEQ